MYDPLPEHREPSSAGNRSGLFSPCDGLLTGAGNNLAEEKKLELQLNSGMSPWLEGQNKNLPLCCLFKVHLERLHETL